MSPISFSGNSSHFNYILESSGIHVNIPNNSDGIHVNVPNNSECTYTSPDPDSTKGTSIIGQLGISTISGTSYTSVNGSGDISNLEQSNLPTNTKITGISVRYKSIDGKFWRAPFTYHVKNIDLSHSSLTIRQSQWTFIFCGLAIFYIIIVLILNNGHVHKLY